VIRRGEVGADHMRRRKSLTSTRRSIIIERGAVVAAVEAIQGEIEVVIITVIIEVMTIEKIIEIAEEDRLHPLNQDPETLIVRSISQRTEMGLTSPTTRQKWSRKGRRRRKNGNARGRRI
jgi:hypothetical protein